MPKPFDLQKALAGKPVLWPDGKPLRRLIHVPEVGGNNVMVIDANGVILWADDNGNTCWGPLTMADPPKKRVEGWVNMHKGDVILGYRPGGYFYASEEEARNAVANYGRQEVVQAHIAFYVEDEA